MISWQSIMSVFNTKGTLLKWLKTLDQSLKDGVLETVTVNSVSEGVITLTFNFADGSTITTPQIDIPQGAQGPQGIPGTNGTNGESFNPMGEWVPDNEYHPFDYVTYNGSSYLCTETIIDGTDAPPLDTAHWQLVAEKGDQGEPGTSPTVNIIEYAEQLPTASETSPAFVQTPDGTLYRKKAVINGVAGELGSNWVKGIFKINTPIQSDVLVDENINFSSNNKNFVGFYVDMVRQRQLRYFTDAVNFETVFSGGSWLNDEYSIVNFGENQTTTSEALVFYLTNAASPLQPQEEYMYIALSDAA